MFMRVKIEQFGKVVFDDECEFNEEESKSEESLFDICDYVLADLEIDMEDDDSNTIIYFYNGGDEPYSVLF